MSTIKTKGDEGHKEGGMVGPSQERRSRKKYSQLSRLPRNQLERVSKISKNWKRNQLGLKNAIIWGRKKEGGGRNK